MLPCDNRHFPDAFRRFLYSVIAPTESA